MKTVLPIANGIALMITIFISYYANTGIFDGNTMGSVSDRYANFFTPAGYAFSIWGVIYLGLLGFVLYTGASIFTKKEADPMLFKIRGLFLLTCLTNSLWVIAWLNHFTGLSVVIMIVLLACLLRIIWVTRMELDDHPFRRYFFVFWPFALYAGWISVALIANMAAWLTKINWDGWGLSAVTWTIIMIAIAGLVNIVMIVMRNLREFGAVGIWALIAVSVANSTKNGDDTVIYMGYAVAFVILIFILINAVKNRKLSRV